MDELLPEELVDAAVKIIPFVILLYQSTGDLAALASVAARLLYHRKYILIVVVIIVIITTNVIEDRPAVIDNIFPQVLDLDFNVEAQHDLERPECLNNDGSGSHTEMHFGEMYKYRVNLVVRPGIAYFTRSFPKEFANKWQIVLQLLSPESVTKDSAKTVSFGPIHHCDIAYLLHIISGPNVVASISTTL